MDPEKGICDFDKLTIGEIDLAVLGRAFWLLRTYFSKATEDGQANEPLRKMVIDYLTDKGPYYAERNIALQMVFDEMLAMPQYLREVEKILGERLGLNDEELEE